jgi:guanyl-specific ribonuclease Sa
MNPARRRLAFLSAAIAAVLSVVLASGSASAASALAAGNGVGAHHPGMILAVGLSQHVSAGEGRRQACSQLRVVAGACVAAEDAGAGVDAARVPFGPGSEKAWNVLDRVMEKGSPPQGYKGGSVFNNLKGRLPSVDGAGNPIAYREWDVNPYVKGVDRGPERLVTGGNGSAYYTGDHYDSFLQFWGPG